MPASRLEVQLAHLRLEWKRHPLRRREIESQASRLLELATSPPQYIRRGNKGAGTGDADRSNIYGQGNPYTTEPRSYDSPDPRHDHDGERDWLDD